MWNFLNKAKDTVISGVKDFTATAKGRVVQNNPLVQACSACFSKFFNKGVQQGKKKLVKAVVHQMGDAVADEAVQMLTDHLADQSKTLVTEVNTAMAKLVDQVEVKSAKVLASSSDAFAGFMNNLLGLLVNTVTSFLGALFGTMLPQPAVAQSGTAVPVVAPIQGFSQGLSVAFGALLDDLTDAISLDSAKKPAVAVP